ncbi:MAG: 5-methyltetrahydropteroyltriglutamate--homocysteine methyltransferase [Halodesulfurarchaeum sp.]
MMKRLATTPGLFPLPDWAKTELAERKGRQKSDLIGGDEDEAVVETYARARQEVIEWQQDAGLDRIVEGQLRWDDMLCHPLAVHEAVDTGGLIRYYDNNNFYREMVVTDELTVDGDVGSELDAASAMAPDDGLQAVLPGPYSLSDLATDDYYGTDADFLAGIASFLAGEIREFPSVQTVFLLEPSLGTNPPDQVESVVDAVSTVARAIHESTGADAVLHPYWGVLPDSLYASLLDSPIDGLGFDLVTEADENEDLVREYGAPDRASLGIVDGQNTRIETESEIDARLESFASTAADPPEMAYLTTNTEPFYLPVNKFQDKLQALANAAQGADR